MSQRTQVGMVEDQKLLLDLLGDFIESKLALSVVFKALTSRDGFSLWEKHKPSIVLVDLNLPDGDGLELCKRIRQLDTKANLIVLTADESPFTLKRIHDLGNLHYVNKGGDFQALHDVLSLILSSGGLASTKPIRAPRPDFLKFLSDRELQILPFFASGLTSDQIATHFKISPRTLERHRSNIGSKLSLATKQDFVTFCLANGLVRLDASKVIRIPGFDF